MVEMLKYKISKLSILYLKKYIKPNIFIIYFETFKKLKYNPLQTI